MLIGEKKSIIKNSFDVSNITLDELTPDLQIVADKCGLDTVLLLLKHLQGTNIYIPRISRLTDYVLRYIKENIAKSIKELALELGVSENFIRRLKLDIILNDA